MIGQKKSVFVAASLVMCSWSGVYGEDDSAFQRALHFEVSQTHNVFEEPRAAYPVKPQYVAVMFVKAPCPMLDNVVGNWDQLRPALAKVVSEPQRKFNNAVRFITGAPPRFVMAKRPINSSPLCLRGVSLEDVKIMVEATIEWASEPAQQKLKEAGAELQERRKHEAELEKHIASLTQQKDKVAAHLDVAKKDVAYDGIEDARASAQEFNRASLLVEVEIVGIQAKLDMIKQQKEKLQKANSTIPQGVSDLLFQMRLGEEIELAGALARKNVIQSLLGKASGFLRLQVRAKELAEALEQAQAELPRARSAIARFEKTLANPPPDMRPVELADNKVMIYPVTFDKEWKGR